MKHLGMALILLAFGFTLAGCGRSKEEEITINVANDPLAEPRNILNRYASGQPMGSEAASFPYLVEQVRKSDPTRAAILEKGFAAIQKASPTARPGLAKELTAKIAPSMKAD